MAAAAVLVGADGELAEPRDVPPTAQALLASLAAAAAADDDGDGSDGAAAPAPAPARAATYTTALAVWSGDGYDVIDWHLHAERLARDAADPSLPALAARRATRALDALALRCRGSDAASEGAPPAPPPRAAMLVVAAVVSGRGPSSPAVVAYAKEAPPYALFADDNDDGQQRQPQQQRQQPRPPLRVVAALGSGGRRCAAAKRCAWVCERRALEGWAAALPGRRYDEVLLVGRGGDAVLEGLVSNFYAIVDKRGGEGEEEDEREEQGGGGGGGGGGGNGNGKDDDNGGGAPTNNAPPHLASLVLQTACAPDVLPGVVQRRVLEAAARLGLAVEIGGGGKGEGERGGSGRGPSLGALRRGRWREALVSNCLRGLAPVGSVSLRRYDGDPGDGDCDDVALPGPAPGPVGRLLMREVLALQRRERLLAAAAAEEG